MAIFRESSIFTIELLVSWSDLAGIRLLFCGKGTWRDCLNGGLIDFDVYSRLVNVIPAVGDKDLAELFADDSISSEELQEIERRKADRK